MQALVFYVYGVSTRTTSLCDDRPLNTSCGHCHFSENLKRSITQHWCNQRWYCANAWAIFITLLSISLVAESSGLIIQWQNLLLLGKFPPQRNQLLQFFRMLTRQIIGLRDVFFDVVELPLFDIETYIRV